MQYIEPLHVPAGAVCPSFEETDTIESSQSCPRGGETGMRQVSALILWEKRKMGEVGQDAQLCRAAGWALTRGTFHCARVLRRKQRACLGHM